MPVAAAGILILFPAIINGVPRGNDLPQHYRTAVCFYDSLRDGILYPGWNSEATGGYGDASPRFDSPGVYYVLAGGRVLTGNWYVGSLLSFALLSAIGGLGVFCWARTLMPAKLAALAGILFTVTPFHVNEIYQGFLLSEYAGSALLPFSFAFVELVCRKGRTRDVIGLSASYALLILTHLPLTVIGSVALLAYAIATVEQSALRKTLIRLCLAVLLGLAASASYWVTMVTELSWLRGANVQPSSWFDYRYNFLFGGTVEGSTTWFANILAALTVLMLCPGLILLRRKDRLNRCLRIKAVAMLALFSFVMATPISRPVWQVLPPLQRVEFPWRWLAVTSMVAPIIIALSIPSWLEKARGKDRPLAIIAAACIVVPFAFTILQVVRSASYLSASEFESLVQNARFSNSVPFWLPVWASEEPRNMTNEIELQDRTLVISSWESQHRVFRIGPGPAAEARVRSFYYPRWKAMAEGKPLATRPDYDGALLISLPSEATSVDLEFREPTRAKVATGVSIVGWALIGATLLLGARRKIGCRRSGCARHISRPFAATNRS